MPLSTNQFIKSCGLGVYFSGDMQFVEFQSNDIWRES